MPAGPQSGFDQATFTLMARRSTSGVVLEASSSRATVENGARLGSEEILELKAILGYAPAK